MIISGNLLLILTCPSLFKLNSFDKLVTLRPSTLFQPKGMARNFSIQLRKSGKRNRKTKTRLSSTLISAFYIVIYSYLSTYQFTNLSLRKMHLTTANINIYSIHYTYISLFFISLYIYMIVKECHNPCFNLFITQYFIIIHLIIKETK